MIQNLECNLKNLTKINKSTNLVDDLLTIFCKFLEIKQYIKKLIYLIIIDWHVHFNSPILGGCHMKLWVIILFCILEFMLAIVKIWLNKITNFFIVLH